MADETPEEKANAFLKAIRNRSTVAAGFQQGGGDQVPVIDSDTFQYLLDHKLILELKKSDLSPGYDKATALHPGITLDNREKSDGYFETPVYVVPGVGAADSTIQSYRVKTANGMQNVLFTDEGNHLYDRQYIGQNMMKRDAEVAAMPGMMTAAQYEQQNPSMKAGFDALLGSISAEAKRQGVEPPRLLIHGPATPDRPPFETKEGHDYIVVGQTFLNFALERDNAAAVMKIAVDPALQQIKNDELSANGLMLKKEARTFYDHFSLGSDGMGLRFKLPPADTEISDALKSKLVQDGRMIRLTQDQLLPPAQDSADKAIFEAKDASGKPIPVYQMDKAGAAGIPSVSEPEARLMKTKEGNPYILMNEGYRVWTEDYVRGKFMRGEEDVQKDILKHRVIPAEQFKVNGTQTFEGVPRARPPGILLPEQVEMQHHYDELMKYVKETSGKMGLDTPPTVLISGTALFSHNEGVARAETSREGVNRIFVSEAELRADLKTDQGLESLKGMIGHELTHIKNGDTTAAGIIRDRSPAVQRYEEAVGDLGGAGPLGSHDPAASAQWLRNEIRVEIPAYLKAHKDERIAADQPSDADLQKVSGWLSGKPNSNHPTQWDRVVALTQEKIEMDKFEREHPGADPRFESQAVTERVMEYMKDKWQLPVQKPDTASTDPKPLDTPKAPANAPAGPSKAIQ